MPERHSPGIDFTMRTLHTMGRLTGSGPSPGVPNMAPTGVVSCRKDDWAAIGGYREGMLFAEDVVFLLDLKRFGRRTGRTLGWIGGAPTTFSTRKFDAYGDWHYAKFPFRLLTTLFSRGGPMRNYAERYWYGQQRSDERPESRR